MPFPKPIEKTLEESKMPLTQWTHSDSVQHRLYLLLRNLSEQTGEKFCGVHPRLFPRLFYSARRLYWRFRP